MNYNKCMNRFHKLVWGAYGIYNEWNSGIIAGGCDNGKICLYNASKLAMDVDSLMTSSDRHVGSVKALDFNSFQVFQHTLVTKNYYKKEQI